MNNIIRADKKTDDTVFRQLSRLEAEAISDGWSAAGFRSEAEKENGYVLYICDDENSVCALLTGYSAVGEGDITNAAVSSEHRRKGLAQRLIAEFERLLPKDTGSIFLEVRESNAPAIALYEKCGFEKLSVRRSFYANPTENAIVMKKEIAEKC